MVLRICLSATDASSLISSSAIMQRLISSAKGVHGSSPSNRPCRESEGRSSRSSRPYAFARLATSRSLPTCNSSAAFKTPPISRRFNITFGFFIPAKETFPLRRILARASEVSCCARMIRPRSRMGSSLLHNVIPSSDVARSASISIILSYSNMW